MGVDAPPNPAYIATIPYGFFALFQMMFAIITPAIITGAFVERIKFKASLLFGLLWAAFAYNPLFHWVWEHGGWLREMGVFDVTGSTVVHIAA
jgi:Amt family ammonium transporter